ncbi:MAG: acylphosphatase [Deltaproteobacteria bacterium]|nr:acylphosphatase [Deltaproteobacteria bacterium]MBI3061711.1 acylphosphatase [Deltaproteobacteria bacterium]
MQEGEKARVRLKIEGRVQGVFFRASTVEQANRLGLKGWVRNCPDGSVEAVAEGAREKIDDLVHWCRRGPPGARVENVLIQWEGFQDEFGEFRIRR